LSDRWRTSQTDTPIFGKMMANTSFPADDISLKQGAGNPPYQAPDRRIQEPPTVTSSGLCPSNPH
jgi:hypothetical protein